MSNPAYELPTLARLLETHNQGDDAHAINEKMRELLRQLGDHSAEHNGTAKGTIAVSVTFAVDRKGVDVEIGFTHKAPPRPKTRDRYFLTERGDGLTLMDPARDTMFAGSDLGRRRAGDASQPPPQRSIPP